MKMSLDDELLKGTKDLMQVGGTMARRHFAKPCYTELLVVDQVGIARKRDGGGRDGGTPPSFAELLELRERHFDT